MQKQGKTDSGMCREVTHGVYCVEAGNGISRSNVYFVQSGSSWVLIDTATPNCGPLIRKTAESLFGTNTRPALILLTHDHPDHAGSAVELARMWDCPVYVHPDELPLVDIQDISTVEKYANPLDRWIILPILRAMLRQRVKQMFSSASIKSVVQTFEPGAPVPNLPDWECIPTPGHTPGHVAFFRTRDRFLITGDAIVTVNLNSFGGFMRWALRASRNQVSAPPWYSTWNWLAAKASVKTLARLEPRVLASGHGMPMSGDEIARELHAFADSFSGPAGKHSKIST